MGRLCHKDMNAPFHKIHSRLKMCNIYLEVHFRVKVKVTA